MTNLIQRARDVAGRLSVWQRSEFGQSPPGLVFGDAAAIIAELIERVEGVERPKLHPPIHHDGDNFDEVAKWLNRSPSVLGKQED